MPDTLPHSSSGFAGTGLSAAHRAARASADAPADEARLGVLLANLGTPDAPTPAAVRRFLAEFLWDTRVVEAPRWLWWLALHGVILRVRPAKSAAAYRQIWTPAGSPLLLNSQALASKLEECLAQPASLEELATSRPALALGMSYGSPSIAEGLRALRTAGAQRIIVLPLYPQYSATTTGSVFDRVSNELRRWRRVPELHFVPDYHEEPAYIEALAASVQAHWRTHRRSHLLFSFHGIPQRYASAGDPYPQQCRRSAALVATRLGLDAESWSMSFQSQVGREEWLRPYTDETLLEYARQGRRQLTLMCPGFATDCLETLEEIAIRNRALFLAAGGEHYEYVPALNASEAHAQLLAGLIRRHAGVREIDEPDGLEPAAGRDSRNPPVPPRQGAAR